MTLEAYKLGDVANVDWGNTSITKSSYTEEGYPAFSAAGQDGFMPIYEHEGDAVVVSAIGARCGKCFWAFGKWIAIKNTIIVKSKDEDICNTAYLYFLLNDEKFWPRSGSGQPFIAIGKAKLLDIHLPNIHTQRKIVDVLWSIQAAKGTREAELALERERKAALMAYLFTHGTRGEALKQTEIGEMPKSWEVKKISEHGCFKVRTSFPSFKQLIEEDKKQDENKIEVLAIKVSDMNAQGNEKWMNSSANVFRISAKHKKKVLEAGAIVFPKRGAAIATNKKRITETFTSLDPNLIALEHNDSVDTNYLFHFFEKIDLKTLQDSTPVPQLNKHNVENVIIPLPTDIEEQREIGKILASCDNVMAALSLELYLLDELFHSMLDELMSGKLSVQPLLEAKKIVKKKVAA